jgi:flagellar hook-associated protein 1 FlgK
MPWAALPLPGHGVQPAAKLGLDQNGNPGTNMFNVSSPNLIGFPTNTGTTNLTTTISDPSALTTSDYTLSYDGTNYTFTRLSDNTKTVKVAGDFPVTLDGVTYSNGGTGWRADHGQRQHLQDPADRQWRNGLLAGTEQHAIAGHGSTDLDLRQRDQQRQRQHAGHQYRQRDHFQYLAGSGHLQAGIVGLVHGIAERHAGAADGGMDGAAPAPAVTFTNPDGTTGSVPAGTAFNYTPGMTISSGGVTYALTGTPSVGDQFNFAPVAANKGTATINAGSVTAPYLTTTTPLTKPTTLTYNTAAAPPAFTISPAVPAGGGTITHKDGTTTAIAGGATSLAYTAGDTYEISGVKFQISGQPSNGDQFTISANTNATSDNRNALALAGLQTANTINGTSFQGSYSQLVATIGNKTNEINVTNTAERPG